MTTIDIFKKCVSLGMTQAGAAGCTANILAESAGRSNNVENRCPISDEDYTKQVDNGTYPDFINDRYGYGLCQWTLPSRKAALYSYAKDRELSIGDEDMQFQFMADEMQKGYSGVWSVLTTTDNPYDAGYKMCMLYERPANTEASSENRGNRAKDIYAQCKYSEVKETSYDPQKVVDLALSQVGYHEKQSNSQLDDFTANSGDANWNKYARDLDELPNFYNGRKNGYAWCDIFVDWCFVTAYGREAAQYLLCQPNNSTGAGCSYSAQFFSLKGRFVKSDPHVGDQIFFGSAWNNVWHTGLVYKVDSVYVYTVEGNSSDRVQKCVYKLGDANIFGYGRPDWNNGSSMPAPVVVEKMCSPKVAMIQNGSKNGFVKSAQILLGARGYNCGGKMDMITGKEIYDGDFGPTTEQSVREFQKKMGLEVDGVIGANTWSALLGSWG